MHQDPATNHEIDYQELESFLDIKIGTGLRHRNIIAPATTYLADTKVSSTC